MGKALHPRTIGAAAEQQIRALLDPQTERSAGLFDDATMQLNNFFD
jgi:hypothetical protein